ncbi:glycoside hydrolase family 92 protein [Infundibulicybe gibba]|nr:glycoside hydrolase family 92 protein [Infundibulicybe gibba]
MAYLLAFKRALLLASCIAPLVAAQPSPDVQKRISAAIKSSAGSSNPDYTAFVNPFIGTDNFGDVCPGASIPFGMSNDPRIRADPTQFIRGLSPMHDSGTGSSLGTYGNFEIMPLLCPGGFNTCTTTLAARQRLRKLHTDDASPGYFAQTLDNNIKMEATPTRRAGLERFTFPSGSKPYFALDLANDLPNSFAGGSLDIDPQKGRITIGGHWGSSFGPGSFHYQAFACYDLLDGGKQKLSEFGVWTGDTVGLDAKGLGQTHLNLSINLFGGVYQSGALFSFDNKPTQVNIRVGVSFRSVEQACANAEEEVGSSSFEDIQAKAKALWQEKLSKIEIDIAGTPPNVTEMLYSSLYRASLTPNNATGETQGLFENTTSFYFDSLYCRRFRTFYPLMTLHSPVEFAQIVDSYIDGWRKNGWMPECRANNLPGSSADNIVAQFAVNYHNEAARLGIDLNELYSAQLTDGELNPPEWNIEGRQVNVYKWVSSMQYGSFDIYHSYAFEDFGIRQVAQLLGKTDDVATYTNRSLFYRNVWDPTVVNDGFKGFSQKRFSNGTFAFTNPSDCSPNDKNETRSCSLQSNNVNGFYESSSWEYSWFAPHDTAHLIELMGGNATFAKRLDHFFDAGYYLAGNEPSFQVRGLAVWLAGNLMCVVDPDWIPLRQPPAKSVDRVREVVFTNFDITPAGLPGNDDQAAMASLLSFHLLGLYPVPSTTQFLLLSPFTPKYTSTIHSSTPSVTINGKPSPRCHFDFYDVFRVGGEVVITLTADKSAADDCLGAIPESISTGGFAAAR